MKKNLFLALLILISANIKGQIIPDSLRVNIDHVENVKSIEACTYLFIDSSAMPASPDKILRSFVPLKSVASWKYIPTRLVTKDFYLAFRAENSTHKDTAFYYFPGTLYAELTLFKQLPDKSLLKIGYTQNNTGLVHIEMLKNETSVFVVRGRLCRTNGNILRSSIAAPDFYPYYKMEIDKTLVTKKIVGILLSGALFMMILFTLVNFYLYRKPEFLYNCLYCACMFMLIFFTAYLSKDAGAFKVFFLGFFDLVLLMAGTIFYLAFTRKFLNTKVIHPGLDKFFAAEQWVITILMIVYTYLHYGTDNFVWEDRMENFIKIISLLAGLIFVIIAFLKKNILMTFLATGTAFQILFYSVSLFLIYRKANTDFVLNSPIFYFEIGVVVSVFFFLLGLTYKNKREIIGKIKEQEAMKLEVEKKGFETRLAVIKAQQEERNRISADMHDDLGAGMTAIRLYSELAKGKIGNHLIPEISKISDSANELLNKMNAIIWSMSSSNDTLGNMVAYIRIYALEYLEEAQIKARFVVPEKLPEIEVSGEIRRNVFLVVKEALHNIVKHASATVVDIILSEQLNGYSLLIRDDGKGIDFDHIRTFGNGLKNMRKRMDAVGISFEILNDHGTVIKLFKDIR